MLDNQYFYAASEDIFTHKDELYLRKEEAQHCAKVLRKKIGDQFFVVDGLGHEFQVAISGIESGQVACKILIQRSCPTELPFEITLAQALIKNDHFDLVVEKATELGVKRIVPVKTERSLVIPKSNKIERWQKIALSAMKQSRRSVLPIIEPMIPFSQLIKRAGAFDRPVLCHESSDMSLRAYCLKFDRLPRGTLIVIGPEGGFTESEVAAARSAMMDVVSLGRRRLRAETAALCAMSLISTLESPPQA